MALKILVVFTKLIDNFATTVIGIAAELTLTVLAYITKVISHTRLTSIATDFDID